jgi:hypothetical protein
MSKILITTTAIISIGLTATGAADTRGGRRYYGVTPAIWVRCADMCRSSQSRRSSTIRVHKSVCHKQVMPWISFPRSWALDSRTRWGSNDERIND